MALGVLSRESVEQAMAEYDELGRDAFLSKHGFGRATALRPRRRRTRVRPQGHRRRRVWLDHPDEGTLKNTEFNGGLQLRSALRPAGFDVVLSTTPGRAGPARPASTAS